MATTLQDKIEALPRKRRKRIEARAAELIAEERSLRDLRKAHELTQVHMAKSLGVGQEGISRIEKRSDLLISTLRDYVEALGGHLRLVAEFPDRPPVYLSGLAAVWEESPRARRRTMSRKTSKHQNVR
jgi:DNA-binding XRE family transcriptional regulator